MCAQLAVDCGAPHAQENAHLSKKQSVAIRIAVAEVTESLHSSLPILTDSKLVRSSMVVARGRTWGRGLAVGAAVISRNRADQLGQSFLIAQLLALANAIRHGERVKEWTQYKNCGW